MNLFFAIILGLAGLAAGIITPYISDRIIKHKCSVNNKSFPDKPFWKWYVRAIPIIINTAFFAAAGYFMENPGAAILISVLAGMSVIFTVIDLRIRIIPNEMVLAMLAVGAVFQLVQYGFRGLLIALACMFVLMLLFLIVGLIVGLGKVGAGDIKLAGAMGLALGYPAVINAALIMSAAIIAYCFFGVWFKKLTLVSMFPFAPFMMLGTVSALGMIVLQLFFF